MPYLVPSAARRQNNLIIRPRAGADVTLVQLDDLAPDTLAHIAPAAFLILRTSPGGQQAWVAVTNAPRGFAARLKEGDGRRQGSVRRHSCRRHRQFQTRLRPELPPGPDRRRSARAERHYADPRRDGGGRAGPADPGVATPRRVLQRFADEQMAQLRALPRRGADRRRR
jgi:hypothetical protein